MNILNSFGDINFVYEIIARLFSIGIVISSLEYLVTLKEYAHAGIFSWKVFKLTPTILRSKIYNQKFDIVFEKKGVGILILLRLISSVLLLIYAGSAINMYLVACIALTSLFLSFRNVVGNDGSDQMNSIVCITLFISFLLKKADISNLGLYFICAQSILSYVVAGIAKLISKKWTSGMAIYEIMNTKTYGDKGIARILKELPPIFTKVLNWNIISFECLYFLVIFFPFPLFLIFLVWGILFHLYNAVLMGLNGFLWAFLASYPAIVYVNLCIHKP